MEGWNRRYGGEGKAANGAEAMSISMVSVDWKPSIVIVIGSEQRITRVIKREGVSHGAGECACGQETHLQHGLASSLTSVITYGGRATLKGSSVL